MKKLPLLCILSVSLLGACADYPVKPMSGPDPERPKLSVEGKTVRVDQEVLVFRADGKPVRIVWSLPAEGPYRFDPRRGIVIEGQLLDEVLRGERTSVVLDTQQDQIGDCQVDESRLSASCVDKKAISAVFKYSIHLTDGKTEVSVDPTIANW